VGVAGAVAFLAADALLGMGEGELLIGVVDVADVAAVVVGGDDLPEEAIAGGDSKSNGQEEGREEVFHRGFRKGCGSARGDRVVAPGGEIESGDNGWEEDERLA
jgi:hypothetical protein